MENEDNDYDEGVDAGYRGGIKKAIKIVRIHADRWEGDKTCAVLNDIDDELERLLK